MNSAFSPVAPVQLKNEPRLPEEGGPRFDVLIPCYNYGHFLADSVESVLSQTVNVRVLIIDDASEDATADIGRRLAEKDARVEFRRHGVNQGHIATYNEGIDWADGEFFLIVSADDLLMPGALSRAAEEFTRNPDLMMVYGRMIHFLDGTPIDDIMGARVYVRPVPDAWMEYFADGGNNGTLAATVDSKDSGYAKTFDTASFYQSLARYNKVPASGTVTRTTIQKRVGGYSTTLPHAGDYEMWLRISAHGRVGYIPRFQAAVRRHSDNMSMQYSRVDDVLQRAQALKELGQSCGHLLPASVLDAMHVQVASEALRVTTVAIEHGWVERHLSLVAVAKSLDPRVTTRGIWGIYLLKRAVGHRIWSVMRKIYHQARLRQRTVGN